MHPEEASEPFGEQRSAGGDEPLVVSGDELGEVEAEADVLSVYAGVQAGGVPGSVVGGAGQPGAAVDVEPVAEGGDSKYVECKVDVFKEYDFDGETVENPLLENTSCGY